MRNSGDKEEPMMRKRSTRIIVGCAALVVLAMLGASSFWGLVVSSPGFAPFPYGSGHPIEYPVRIDPSQGLAPKWSDDGSRIAFAVVTDRDARRRGYSDDSRSPDFGVVHYVAAADGSGVWQVERGFSPEPSRDGSRLIYATDRYHPQEISPFKFPPPVNYEIETAAVDGSDRRRLTDDPTPDMLPAWSPDGSQIAFVKHGDDYYYQGLYAMNSDGSGLRQIAPPNRYTREADEYEVERWGKSEIEVADISVRGPVWSPAGDDLAFVAEELRGGTLDSWSLYMAKPDDSDRRLLFRATTYFKKDNGPHLTFFSRRILSFPAWHPDGRTVAFMAFEGDQHHMLWGEWPGGTYRIMSVGRDSPLREIVSFNLKASGEVIVGAEPHIVPSLEWSPDGSRLMFSSWNDDSTGRTGRLYLVDADGKNLRRIGDDTNATFSPDGLRIAAVSQRYSYSEPVLYTMDLNGSDIRPLVARGEDGKLKALKVLNAPPRWWERLWDMVTP